MFLGAAIALAVSLATLAFCLNLLRRSRLREERLWALTGEGLAEVALDGRVRRASAALAALAGTTPEGLTGTALVDLVHPEDHERFLTALNPLAPGGRIRTAPLRVRTANGGWTSLRVRARVDRAAQVVDVALGEPGGSEHGADAFDRVFTASPIGMAVIADGVVLRVNHRMAELVGEDRTGAALETMLGEDDLAMVRAQLARMVARELHAVTLSVSLRHADGTECPVTLSVAAMRDDAGEARQYVVQVQDRSATQQLEAEIKHATEHDSLTGLLNRSALLPLLRELPGAPAALAVLDVDGLSAINELYGIAAGDAVLEIVATRLEGALRDGAALARIGGDEFGVLLADVDAASASRVVDRLQAAIAARPVELAGTAVTVTVCGGLALSDDLLAHASEALAEAKRSGPGSLALFDARMHERRDSGLEWANKVRRGLHDGRMLLDAQPITDVATGLPVHYELLLRLRDDDGALVRPNAFLGHVRRHGLMGAVDEWVVHQAIRLAGNRERQGAPVDLAVNLSEDSINDRSFLAAIVQRLVDAPEAGPHLIFELSERAVLQDRGHAAHLMARLGEFGCRFALDNFGAGTASLANLKRLPVEFLKLDGKLTRNLSTDPSDHAIAEAIVQAAHALGKQVVAECVEDEEIFLATRDLGVDLAQGLWVGRPQRVCDLIRVAA